MLQSSPALRARDTFAWLNQVQDEATPFDFAVAYAIVRHINKDTGMAYPGIRRLAEMTKLAQNTITASVRRLEAGNHLIVIPGKRGRGHASQYRLNLKSSTVEAFPSDKSLNGNRENTQTTPLKPSTVAPELILNQYYNQEEAPAARLPMMKGWEAKQINRLIDRIECEQDKPRPGETIYEKVARLERISQRSHSITAAFNLEKAWLEAADAGLAYYPTTEEKLYNDAKPYFLDVTGPIIENTPILTISSSQC